jgi:hypothetical protein
VANATQHEPKPVPVAADLHQQVKIRAAERGESMREITERALRRELSMTARNDRAAS